MVSKPPKPAKPARPPRRDCEGHRARLRKRFECTELEGFQEYEILELLLAFAIPRRDVKPIAREALRHFGSLNAVFDAPREKLLEVRGLGPASAHLIKQIPLIANYCLDHPGCDGPFLCDRHSVLRHLRSNRLVGVRENLVVLFFGGRHRLLDIADYPPDENAVPRLAREIAKNALIHYAVGVLIVHGWPDDSCCPETALDRKLLRAIAAAFNPIGIHLYDYIAAARSVSRSLIQLYDSHPRNERQECRDKKS